MKQTQRILHTKGPTIILSYGEDQVLHVNKMISTNSEGSTVSGSSLSNLSINRPIGLQTAWHIVQDSRGTQWIPENYKETPDTTLRVLSTEVKNPLLREYCNRHLLFMPSNQNRSTTAFHASDLKYDVNSNRPKTHEGSRNKKTDLEMKLKDDINKYHKPKNHNFKDNKFRDYLGKVLDAFLLKIDEFVMKENEEKMLGNNVSICGDICERLRIEILIAVEKLAAENITKNQESVSSMGRGKQKLYEELINMKQQLLGMRRKYCEILKKFNKT